MDENNMSTKDRFLAAAKLFSSDNPSALPEAKLFADAGPGTSRKNARLAEMSSPDTAWCWVGEIMRVMLMHQELASKPGKFARKWDGVTPYSIHPVWCAMMILHEPLLDPTTRVGRFTGPLASRRARGYARWN